MNPVIHVTQCYYPESDGKPMGETDLHRKEMIRHIELLTEYFRGQEVYVSGDLLVYYVQGDPKKFVVPDAFVVKGISPRNRRIYKVWEEKRAPNVVFETTSRKTRRKDTEEKPRLYSSLGVQEYFLFDPDREYLEPPLQGYRLAKGKYVAIPADDHGGLVSQELRMRLVLDDGKLQFLTLVSGQRLLTSGERAELEAKRADQEAAARVAAEAEIVRLRAELARRPSI